MANGAGRRSKKCERKFSFLLLQYKEYRVGVPLLLCCKVNIRVWVLLLLLALHPYVPQLTTNLRQLALQPYVPQLITNLRQLALHPYFQLIINLRQLALHP